MTDRKPKAMPDRTKFLGGSDAAAVLGYSPWTTPVQLWLEKTHRAAPRVISPDRERMFKRGKKLEPVVIDMVIDKLRERGHEVLLLARNKRYRHPVHRFIWVEIDAELLIDGEHVNCDAKTVTGFARAKWGEEDTEDVPMEYAAQFLTGLACTPLRRRCLVAALIGLDDVSIYWVVHDEGLIADIIEELRVFWIDHVKADKAPDLLRFSDSKALYPLGNGKTIEARPEVAETVEKVRRLGIEERKIKAEREELKLDVSRYLEDYSQLTKGGRLIATFNSHEETVFEEEAFRRSRPDVYALFCTTRTVRVLRIKQPRR